MHPKKGSFIVTRKIEKERRGIPGSNRLTRSSSSRKQHAHEKESGEDAATGQHHVQNNPPLVNDETALTACYRKRAGRWSSRLPSSKLIKTTADARERERGGV